MVPLIEQVTTDDQVEAAEIEIRFSPCRLKKVDRREAVEVGVVTQKFFGQGMMVSRGDVCAALLQHETGKADAASDFQNALAFDREPAHFLCEGQPRGPHNPEDRPSSGGN